MPLYLKKSYGPKHMSKGLTVEIQTKDGTDTGEVLAWGEKGCTVQLSKGLRGSIYYENILKAYPTGHQCQSTPLEFEMAPQKLEQNQGVENSTGQLGQSTEPIVTVEEVHDAADWRGIKWDDDPDFMRWCEQMTGSQHLDDMTPADLQVVKEAIEQGERPASIQQWADAVEPVKKSWWRKILRRA